VNLMPDTLEQTGLAAKNAAAQAVTLNTDTKNTILNKCADALIDQADYILEENGYDLECAKDIKESFRDRLTLTMPRIRSMSDGLRQVALLPDPIGEAISMKTLPNGLSVAQKRVPMGVIYCIRS